MNAFISGYYPTFIHCTESNTTITSDMMSLTCKTAIKSVIYLASKRDSGEKSSIKEIAAFIAASEHTVGKLLQTLVKKKIINSSKGPNGGFYISGTQYTKPIVRIVEAIDGPEVFKECGLGLKKCSSEFKK